MDVSNILGGLNEEQRAAVTDDNAPNVLVLAGAGSGKTRVLVHRVAWLVQVKKVSLWNIMVVTFTNKAAAQMRTRIEKMLNISLGSMWIGTFHGLAHRFLRAHFKEAGLPQNFQIMDSDDQYRALRRVLADFNLDEKLWAPRQMQWQINQWKDEGLRPEHIVADDLYLKTAFKIYHQYEKNRLNNGLVDFAELLLKTHEIMRDNAGILKVYQQRFSHIMVDEFQDTNNIQYAWIRLLAGMHNSVFVVGDDDQSIYGWRGAKIANIRQFSEDFKDTATFKLEQNYRSSANILNAANAVISQNTERLGKKLWTEDQEGELISLYQAYNDVDEAMFVSEKIQQLVQQGNMQRSEIAILYRSNAQSRLFEEKLINSGIPYRVYGGLRFFDRAEIKNALAYLRLIRNNDDDAAFERVVNFPTRGIGNKTLDIIRSYARDNSGSLWSAVHSLIANKALNNRAAGALSGFVALIENLTNTTANLDLAESIEKLLSASTLLEHYAKEQSVQAEARVENLKELVSAAKEFIHEDREIDKIDDFLARAALDAGDSQAGEWEDCVQLMTLHSAKGLEFQAVFLCGMEEGLFPHHLSTVEAEKLEEERRLCYVGITRARQQLFISLAEIRRLYGEEKYQRPSRFLAEIPSELLYNIKLDGAAEPDSSFYATSQEAPYHTGQQIRHNKFGEGTIISVEGSGDHTRLLINFGGDGDKWLIASYVNLEIV